MTIEQMILESLRDLPVEKQQEVLDFVEFLKTKSFPKAHRHNTTKAHRHNIKGLCADLGVHITEDEITQAQREMWDNFPRKDIA